MPHSAIFCALTGFALLCLRVTAAAKPPLPHWSAPAFDAAAPLAGIALLPNASHTAVFMGSPELGDYNHGAMLHYSEGVIHLTWKNGVGDLSEDAPGQRVRYSQSADGVSWAPSSILFPSLNTSAQPVALFAGPFAVLRGRLYASASAAVIAAGDAQGAQFCVWPDGLDPRNAGPPGQRQPVNVLLLRRVGSGGAQGPAFWATNTVPHGFEAVSAAAGVVTLNATDAETQGDVHSGALSHDMAVLPCSDPATSGTTKCEAVRGGAQDYEHLPLADKLANERSHWVLGDGSDVLVYRSHASALYASVRAGGRTAWSDVALTNVPNDNSNINAGMLPGGGVALVANAVPNRIRDPLTVAFARDGLDFATVRVVASCTLLGPLVNSTCTGRHGKNGNGPSYPQMLSVIAPAPLAVQGYYVVSTNNKEDVIVSRFPWEAVLPLVAAESPRA